MVLISQLSCCFTWALRRKGKSPRLGTEDLGRRPGLGPSTSAQDGKPWLQTKPELVSAFCASRPEPEPGPCPQLQP